MARGGARAGSGRKPKDRILRALDGGVSHRQDLPVSVVLAEVEAFDPPNSLTPEQLAVWQELAPHAFKARTLTKGTLVAFVMLCRNVVIERALAAKMVTAGSADHRGMIQRVDGELAAFSLRPCGKAIYEAETAAKAPANPLDRFLKRA